MKVITDYRKACEKISQAFIKKYYPDADYDNDTFWVADEPGTIFFVCDRFFNIDRMIEALELKATYEQIIEYDDAELEAATKEPSENLRVNFRFYVRYGWGRSKSSLF